MNKHEPPLFWKRDGYWYGFIDGVLAALMLLDFCLLVERFIK